MTRIHDADDTMISREEHIRYEAVKQDPGRRYEESILRVQREANARGGLFTPPEIPQVLNAVVHATAICRHHARHRRTMDRWDEMTAFMEGGPEPDFLRDDTLFRHRLEGTNITDR